MYRDAVAGARVADSRVVYEQLTETRRVVTACTHGAGAGRKPASLAVGPCALMRIPSFSCSSRTFVGGGGKEGCSGRGGIMGGAGSATFCCRLSNSSSAAVSYPSSSGSGGSIRRGAGGGQGAAMEATLGRDHRGCLAGGAAGGGGKVGDGGRAARK